MIFKTYTVVFEGVEARCIEVQCALSAGLPGCRVSQLQALIVNHYYQILTIIETLTLLLVP